MGDMFCDLGLRLGEINAHKVASHFEPYGLQAVAWGYAKLVDVIGNALADEAAELAASLLRPDQTLILQAKETDDL